MKRFVLVFLPLLFLSLAHVQAQSTERHPISTASIASHDGKIELLFDDAVTEQFTVEVRDLTGKTVYVLQSELHNNGCQNLELPAENLRKGIYMVLITGVSGKTKTLKLQRN
jgi:methionine-rich copper-binding protein CopC